MCVCVYACTALGLNVRMCVCKCVCVCVCVCMCVCMNAQLLPNRLLHVTIRTVMHVCAKKKLYLKTELLKCPKHTCLLVREIKINNDGASVASNE